MKKITLFVLILSSITVFSQSKKKALIESMPQVVEAAKADLDIAVESPEGEIYLYVTEHNIKGEYTFDITAHEKGKVASVFCAERVGGSIPMQNNLKDIVKEFQFSFKMPKGKKYKFTYIFKFK